MSRMLVALSALMILAGCGPKPAPEIARTSFPADLSVVVNDETMTLAWVRQGKGPISGYNIYISTEPLVTKYPSHQIDPAVETYNVTPFPGDTNPDDGIEYFEARGLDNGVKYYVSVRIVYPDQSVSKPTAELLAVCGPRGKIELAGRYFGEPDGFSFAENKYVDPDAIINDLYYFHKDDVDYLNSPKRLDAFINDTKLLVLPFRGSIEEVSARVMKDGLVPTADLVKVKVGDWVLLKCENDAYALVNVLAFNGVKKERRVTLYYAYTPLVGELLF